MSTKGIKNWTINRVYKCTNCSNCFSFEQKAISNFKKKCPSCLKNTLIIDSGHCNISVIMDVKRPKTLGALGDKNLHEREKQLGPKRVKKNKNYKPFWRKNKKINYDILRNPSRYIETGQ
jgi:hypothetical protein